MILCHCTTAKTPLVPVKSSRRLDWGRRLGVVPPPRIFLSPASPSPSGRVSWPIACARAARVRTPSPPFRCPCRENLANRESVLSTWPWLNHFQDLSVDVLVRSTRSFEGQFLLMVHDMATINFCGSCNMLNHLFDQKRPRGADVGDS